MNTLGQLIPNLFDEELVKLEATDSRFSIPEILMMLKDGIKHNAHTEFVKQTGSTEKKFIYTRTYNNLPKGFGLLDCDEHGRFKCIVSREYGLRNSLLFVQIDLEEAAKHLPLEWLEKVRPSFAILLPKLEEYFYLIELSIIEAFKRPKRVKFQEVISSLNSLVTEIEADEKDTYRANELALLVRLLSMEREEWSLRELPYVYTASLVM